MLTFDTCGLVILASGHSARFGPDDKLLADLGGRPLIDHSASLASIVEFRHRVAVIQSGNEKFLDVLNKHNVSPVWNDRPDVGRGHSLALGIAACAAQNCSATFVLLADMPFIKLHHLQELRKMIGKSLIAIANNGSVRTPPVLFSNRIYKEVIELANNSKGQSVVNSVPGVVDVPMSDRTLLDVDTKEGLEHARRYF